MESELHPASELSRVVAPSASASLHSAPPAPGSSQHHLPLPVLKKKAKKSSLEPCDYASAVGAPSHLKGLALTPGNSMGPTALPAPSSSQASQAQRELRSPMMTSVLQDLAKAPQEGKPAVKTPHGTGEHCWLQNRRRHSSSPRRDPRAGPSRIVIRPG